MASLGNVPWWLHAILGVLTGGVATPGLLAGDAMAGRFKEQVEKSVNEASVNGENVYANLFKYLDYDVGQWLNNITGVSASQDWQTGEREASQEYATGERIAAQDFTHQENQLARDWQERLSNTAIQRQMADAQAAGVNPYYLFGGGSSAGAGVPMASGSSGSANGSGAALAPGSGNSAAAVSSAVSSVGNIIGQVIKALATKK